MHIDRLYRRLGKDRFLRAAALLWLALLTVPTAVLAQPADFTAALSAINQTGISQSPRFLSDERIFAMRILDANRQLVGRIDDVRFDESGSVTALISEINNVGRAARLIETPVSELRFLEEISAFEIALVPERLDNPLSAESLAAIAPAAGGGQTFGLKAALGAEIRNEAGRWIGRVQRVVFDDQGAGIAALVLQDVPGAARYTQIAVPFDPRVIRVRSDFGRVEFRADAATANAISAFARENR